MPGRKVTFVKPVEFSVVYGDQFQRPCYSFLSTLELSLLTTRQ